MVPHGAKRQQSKCMSKEKSYFRKTLVPLFLKELLDQQAFNEKGHPFLFGGSYSIEGGSH